MYICVYICLKVKSVYMHIMYIGINVYMYVYVCLHSYVCIMYKQSDRIENAAGQQESPLTPLFGSEARGPSRQFCAEAPAAPPPSQSAGWRSPFQVFLREAPATSRRNIRAAWYRHMYACAHACLCTRTYMYIYIYIDMCVCTYIHSYVHGCISLCMHVYMYQCKYVYT